MFPTDGATFDELAVRADAAMYRAKQDGRHTYRFFSGDMLANAAERLELLSALRKAVENDELVVHYQPQVSLADGSDRRGRGAGPLAAPRPWASCSPTPSSASPRTAG